MMPAILVLLLQKLKFNFIACIMIVSQLEPQAVIQTTNYQ